MTKEQLLNSLAEIIRHEETLVTTYTSHLQAVMQWSGISEEDRVEVRSILTTLCEDSKEHRQHFTELAASVKRGELDVY